VSELVDFTGGLNSAEPPDQLNPGQLSEIRNLEYKRTKGLKRRRGERLTLATAGVFGVGFNIVSLFRHTPGQSEITMELWGASDTTPPTLARSAAGAAWATIALADPVASAALAWFLKGVSFNGKLFLPYDSAVDRLHVWDGTSVRRVGISGPAVAPTVANTGAGAYAAIPRFYKVQFLGVAGPGTLTGSPLSAAVSFTPSGAGTAARVTRPAPPGDGESAWRLLASADGVNYYLISGFQVLATTFVDDTTAPSLYPTLFPAEAGYPTGADYYTPPISPKFILVDGAQLLLGGSWEQVAFSSTVFFTPALGTSGFGIADDERVPTNNRIDIEPQLGGGLTGMGGPIGGTPVVFKIDRTYLLNPTGDVNRPYTRQLVSDVVGCISYQGIVLAEDEQGSPALYWPARRGYYRYGAGGVEFCGADIEDLWGTLNTNATYGVTACYHRDAGQIWIFLPVGTDNIPTVRLKFHIARARRGVDGVRGGWTRDDGPGAACSSACMFSETPAAVMSLRLKPYLGHNTAPGTAPRVFQADADGINTDQDVNAGPVPYTASLVTRAVDKGIGQQFGIQNLYVQGVAETAPVTLNVSIRRNFDPADTIPAVPVALATQRGALTVTGLELSECEYVQIKVADQAALAQHWAIDRIGLRVRDEAPKG